jgi:hypothetical protein
MKKCCENCGHQWDTEDVQIVPFTEEDDSEVADLTRAFHKLTPEGQARILKFLHDRDH